MVSLFLLGHDQYLIMFKDSNVFEFTNFPFKSKYNNSDNNNNNSNNNNKNNTVVYSVNGNYLFFRGKQEKKLLK